MIDNIMQKECVIIVIIRMVELKNHGSVFMTNYMPMDYARIVTLTNITR
jgi:hypothetical protein